MATSASAPWQPVKPERLSKQFSRLGWLGFWIQVAMLAIPLLLLVYVLNFVDRGLLAVVARPLKAEIEISDTAWGLLTGFGFALLYTTAGIPIARLAETRNRVWIMAVCLAFWSVMTAACGLATDVAVGGFVISAFWILLACRIGVGLGEAGCTPPATSLIADYFPPRRRPAAIGYYAMGVTLGTLLANLVGGPIADWFGWRAAYPDTDLIASERPSR
jgi:MFS family permease